MRTPALWRLFARLLHGGRACGPLRRRQPNRASHPVATAAKPPGLSPAGRLSRIVGDGPIAVMLAGVMLLSMLGETQATAGFPEAQGRGREAQGGRGGRVIEVANLNDSGPGSLRACVLETGPRNCIFRVSGVIVLTRSLLIDGEKSAFLSIYGQTAPGLGITITVDPNSTSFMQTPLIVRNTHDVIVQNIRSRSQAPKTTENVDAVTVEESRRVIVDHVSGSWATDENVNTQGQATDITISHSIFGEGLRVHSKCALLGSDGTGPQSISFWRNLCISNNDRNPDLNFYAGSCIDIVDNLFYNARSEWAEIFSQKPGGTTASLIGNYFKAGPSTLPLTYAINFNPIQSVAFPSLFLLDNAAWAPGDKTLELIAPDTTRFIAEAPACSPGVETYGDAVVTYHRVLAEAGTFPRDGVDARLIRQVGAIGSPGKGELRSSPGTITPIEPAKPYTDEDRDGMADAAEARFGATAGVSDGWTGLDENGQTRFDRFMHWLMAERMAARYPD
jgi:pectate lyase